MEGTVTGKKLIGTLSSGGSMTGGVGTVFARDGITPHIGENGNWWLGDKDTGVHAQGERGEKGDKGDTGAQGIQGVQGVQGVQGIQGDKGETGEKGDKGDTYVLTGADKQEIAEMAAEIVKASLPSAEEVDY